MASVTAANIPLLPDFIRWKLSANHRFCRTEVHFRLARKLGIGIVAVLCVRITTELKE